jgi:hypothetical protein
MIRPANTKLINPCIDGFSYSSSTGNYLELSITPDDSPSRPPWRLVAAISTTSSPGDDGSPQLSDMILPFESGMPQAIQNTFDLA